MDITAEVASQGFVQARGLQIEVKTMIKCMKWSKPNSYIAFKNTATCEMLHALQILHAIYPHQLLA